MELFEAFIAHINHMSGLVPVILDVFRQRLWNWKMLLFVLSSEEGRGQIVVAAVDHDVKAGIGLEGLCKVGGNVQRGWITVVSQIPLGIAELSLGQVSLSLTILQVLAHIIIEERHIR